jgi:hypothetical protein
MLWIQIRSRHCISQLLPSEKAAAALYSRWFRGPSWLALSYFQLDRALIRRIKEWYHRIFNGWLRYFSDWRVGLRTISSHRSSHREVDDGEGGSDAEPAPSRGRMLASQLSCLRGGCDNVAGEGPPELVQKRPSMWAWSQPNHNMA